MVRYSFLVRLSHPLLHAGLSRRILDNLISTLEHADWNREIDLFCRLKVNDEFKLRCLLHRQIRRFGTFQYLVNLNSRAPIEVGEARPVGHEAALIDKLFRGVNSRQAVIAGKFGNPLSFGEKGTISGCHHRVDLFLFCSIKGALQTFGVELSRDLL